MHEGVIVHVTVQGTAFSAANLEISDVLFSGQNVPNLGQEICIIDCCSEFPRDFAFFRSPGTTLGLGDRPDVKNKR